MTGLMAAVIFLIRGYVRIRKGQLKKAAQELPAGSMPLADMEAWEIPTLLDEPKPLHFLWFMIQYVIGVLMKMPFYWHLIYWFFFADVFLCFFCQYLDGMHGFIRDHQKIANLPVETMQRTGKLILKIAVLLLVLFVLPSALYGKDPIAEAIAGYEPKELESDLTIETPEAEAPQGMEQADLSDMLGDKEYKPMPQWIQNLFTAVMYLVMVAVGIAVLRAIYQSVKMREKPSQRMRRTKFSSCIRETTNGKICRGGGKRKRAISPRICVSAGSIKNDQKAGKYQPTGAETPAELEERNELSGDGMRRLHDGYEKPVTAARAAQKKRRKRCGTDLKPVPGSSPQPIEKAEQPACKDTVQNDRSGDGENFRTDAEDLSFFFIFNRRSCNRVGKAGDRDERTAAGKGDDFLIDVEAG